MSFKNDFRSFENKISRNGRLSIGRSLFFSGVVLILFCHSANSGVVNEEAFSNQDFLRKLHDLVKSPPLTAVHIAENFGWTPLKKEQPEGRPYWTQKYETPFYPQVKSAESSGKGGMYDLSIKLNQLNCISGDEVLAEFGGNYERIIAAYDTFSEDGGIDEKELKVESVEGKRNRDRFMGGAIYRVKIQDDFSKISFNLSGQKCFDSIEVTGPGYQGVRK